MELTVTMSKSEYDQIQERLKLLEALEDRVIHLQNLVDADVLAGEITKWRGNPDYYQTGLKKGQMKRSKIIHHENTNTI